MHTTPNISLSSLYRADTYAAGLNNANLFQTDFAALERRQYLHSLQPRLTIRALLICWFRERVFMAKTIHRTLRRHGPIRGLRPAVVIVKQDLEAYLHG